MIKITKDAIYLLSEVWCRTLFMKQTLKILEEDIVYPIIMYCNSTEAICFKYKGNKRGHFV